MGVTVERVLRAPHAGMVRPARAIGDIVKKGDVVLYVDETPVRAAIDGVVRGLIRPMTVQDDEKLGDVDPSGDVKPLRHHLGKGPRHRGRRARSGNARFNA